MAENPFDAFISYCSGSDRLVAHELRHALQRMAKPWYRRRSLRVFLDSSNVSATARLKTYLRDVIRHCEFLVLVASPQAAASVWVTDEISTFLEDHPIDHLVLIVAAGDVRWSVTAGGFDWSHTTALPRILQSRYSEEPKYVDLRWVSERSAFSVDARFQDAVAEVFAALTKSEKDAVIGEDLRQHRRTVRLAGAALVVLLMLLLISVAAGWYARVQRQRAEADAAAARESLALVSLRDATVRMAGGDDAGALAFAGRALGLAPAQASAQSVVLELLLHRRWPQWIAINHAAAGHVAWSPDGKLAAAAFVDGELQIWNTQTGEAVGSRVAHGDSIQGLAWSPDSSRFVTGSTDGTARIWDAHSGRAVGKPVQLGTGWVSALSWSPDGKRIVAASDRGRMAIADGLTGVEIAGLSQGGSGATVAAWSPDGRFIATTAGGFTAQVWDSATFREVGPPLSHNGQISTLAWCPDSSHLATAALDRTAKVWNPSSGRSTMTLSIEVSGLHSLSCSPDGAWIASGDLDGVVHVWDTESNPHLLDRKPLDLKSDSGGGVWSVSWSSDSSKLLWISGDAAHVWDLAEPGRDTVLRHDARVLAAAWSPDGRRVITGSEDHTVRIWEVRRRDGAEGVLQHNSTISTLGWQGTHLTAITSGGMSYSWDAPALRQLRPPVNQCGFVVEGSASLSPDGSRVASGSSENAALVCDLATGKEVFALRHEKRDPGTIIDATAWSPDGQFIATASEDFTVRVWNGHTGAPAGGPLRHSERVSQLAWTSDSKRLVTLAGDDTLRTWDPRAGKQLTLAHLANGSMALAPDDRRLLLESGRDAIIVNLQTGDRAGPTFHHRSSISVVDWSRDGRRIATGCDDGSVHIWDASSGYELAIPSPHVFKVRAISWSQDSQWLATGSEDNTVHVSYVPLARLEDTQPLVEIAEFVGGLRVTPSNTLESVGDWPSRVTGLKKLRAGRSQILDGIMERAVLMEGGRRPGS